MKSIVLSVSLVICSSFVFSQQDERFTIVNNPVIERGNNDFDSNEFAQRIPYIGIWRSSPYPNRPGYKLLLYSDGKIEYVQPNEQRTQNLAAPGRLAIPIYNKIAKYIIENRIADLADDYQTGPDNTNRTIFAFQLDGKRKVIRIQTTLFGPPSLWALQAIMDDTLNRIVRGN